MGLFDSAVDEAFWWCEDHLRFFESALGCLFSSKVVVHRHCVVCGFAHHLLRKVDIARRFAPLDVKSFCFLQRIFLDNLSSMHCRLDPFKNCELGKLGYM